MHRNGPVDGAVQEERRAPVDHELPEVLADADVGLQDPQAARDARLQRDGSVDGAGGLPRLAHSPGRSGYSSCV